MIIRYHPDFFPQYKKLNVRIRNHFDRSFEIFVNNPLDASLKSKLLRDEWKGYKSIQIGDSKNDYRVIYQESMADNQMIVSFIAIGTHKELFQPNKKEEK